MELGILTNDKYIKEWVNRKIKNSGNLKNSPRSKPK